MVNSQSSFEYETKKQKIIQSDEKLTEYLNQRSRWQKISRFENDAPRDQNIASTTAESLNAIIARLHLKNKEPLEVLNSIYDIGFHALKSICWQRNYLTDVVNECISIAMTISNVIPHVWKRVHKAYCMVWDYANEINKSIFNFMLTNSEN